MKKFLLIAIFFMSQSYALQFCYEEAGSDWCYDVSTLQAFYIFNIENAVFDYEGGSRELSTGDALGAFKKDVNGIDRCVGFLRVGDENQPNGNIITLAAMGDDGSFPNYLNAGEVPSLKLFDFSTGDEVCVTTSGAALNEWENFGVFNLHGLLDQYGDPYPESYLSGNDQDCDTCIYGLDNDDTSYVEDSCDCQGDLETCDCNNVPLDGYCNCNGETEDACGTCDNNPDNDCTTDCNGELGGNAYEDDCGVCDDNPDNDNFAMDCNNDCDGNAFNNDCGCVSGNTGLEIDCCEVCGDEYAINYSNVGLCDGEEIYDDSNGNGQVDAGEEYSNASLCIPGNVEELSAQQSGTNEQGLVVGGSIKLNWDTIAGDIAEYEIQRIDEDGLPVPLFAGNSDGIYIDNNLLPSSFYNYKIRAIHEGDSVSLGWSDDVTQQTLGLSVPQILSVNEGEEELMISLSMPGNITTFNQENYSYRLYRTCLENDCDITEIYAPSLYHNDRNLEPNIEYCYTAKAVYDNVFLSEESNQVCGTPKDPTGWTIAIQATILGLGVFEETDLENYFGMHPDATNGYDAGGYDYGDIPEPPPNPGNYIQLYFPHDDWIAPYSNFTQDVREERSLSDNLEIWQAEILSNMDGPVELKFIFDDWGSSIDDINPPINFPIYILIDGVYELIEMPRCLGVDGAVDNEGDECLENMSSESCTGSCEWLEDVCLDIEVSDPTPSAPGSGDELIASMKFYEDLDGDGEFDFGEDLPDNKLECESHLKGYMWFGNNIIEYNSVAYQYQNLDVIAGNIPPQTPTGITAVSYEPENDPAAAWVALSWDETEECCQTIESRYPATHYYIYRMFTEESEIPGQDPIITTELIDNCNTPNGGEDGSGPLIGTFYGLDDNEDGECNEDDVDCRIIKDKCNDLDGDNEENCIECDDYRQLFKGIVPADQFHFVDSTLDLRALGYLEKLIDIKDECDDDETPEDDGCTNNIAQWKFENARHIFETEFTYVITAVNEDFPNSADSLLASFVAGTESDFSIQRSSTTRINLNPITNAGEEQFKWVEHDGYHNSMESFEDTGLDGQPDADNPDFLDYGSDGILSVHEPAYHPINNRDPNGDDYNDENGNGEWDEGEGTEGNFRYDEGEPGEGDGKFTFLDFGADLTQSIEEAGYDPGTCSDNEFETEGLCLQAGGEWTERLDPWGDDWNPLTNPTGTEGNFIHDQGEYSEQFSDTGCQGCDEPYDDLNSNGSYDLGEDFVDCENGICETDDAWDSNIMGNGVWDSAAGNGVWDGNRDYVTVFLDGSQSSDPEYGFGEDALDFVWQQIAGPNVYLNTLVDNGKVQPIFNAVVPYDSDVEVYEFTLVAEDTYFKGWPPEAAYHTFPDNVRVTVHPEENEAPEAVVQSFIPGDNNINNNYNEEQCEALEGDWNIQTFECSNPNSVFCSDEWECDYSVFEYDEAMPVLFDYSDEENILGPTWRIPHDGDPYTNLAKVGLIGENSQDVLVGNNNEGVVQEEFDEIFYNWFTDSPAEPFNDIGSPPNGQFDPEETFFDLNNNGIWDDGDPYSGQNIIINRSAKEHVISLEVIDAYGSSNQVSEEIKVLPEINTKPFAEAGSDQIWYLDEFSSMHEVKLPYSNLFFNEEGNNEWMPLDQFRQINLSYDPDTLKLFDCGSEDGLCDEDEEGFMLYGPDGDYDTGDEVFDPNQDGCTNLDFYLFAGSDCVVGGSEGNNEWDCADADGNYIEGCKEYIDYDRNGDYTEDLGDGFGENYFRDELSYIWYMAGDTNAYAYGDTVTLNLETGNYVFYLEVCDPYDGYSHEDFDPFTNSWSQIEYAGCSIDSVNIIILDEEPPAKPSWIDTQVGVSPLSRSLYSMDLDWNYNVDSECVQRSDFEEECKPGFVDEYQIFRNGSLISTYDAWVDGYQDGEFKLDQIEYGTDEGDDDYLSNNDKFYDCQYVCVDLESDFDTDGDFIGNLSFNDKCNIDNDCAQSGGGKCMVIDESCSHTCDSEDPLFCLDRANFEVNEYMPSDGNQTIYNYFVAGVWGNGWYDPPESLIEDRECNGTFDFAEEFTDCNSSQEICQGEDGWNSSMGNGRWDPAEKFRDCNADFTICDTDDAWDSILGDVDPSTIGEYNEGEPFTDTNGNGTWEREEVYVDALRPSCDPTTGAAYVDADGNLILSDNDEYDFADTYEDWNDNGQWDSGDIFISGESSWDTSEDGYSGDYIRSYPNFRDGSIGGEELMPNTEYCYFIVAVNSSGVSSYPSDVECAYTALLPTVNIISPNGAEIYTKGELFDVRWEVEDGYYMYDPYNNGNLEKMPSDKSYIEKIQIEYMSPDDAGYPGDDDGDGNPDHQIWYTENYRDLEVENTAQVSIYDLENIKEFEIRITITDIGGFTSGNTFENLPDYQFYRDVSDDNFTLSTTRLSSQFESGWSLFGSPLDLSDSINVDLDGNFLGNDMLANLNTLQNLGDFGISWYVYNQDGEFPINETDPFPFEHGRGYILTLFEQSSATLNGKVVNVEDPTVYEPDAMLTLNDGWNLISNKLVSNINKENLMIKTSGQFYSWADAVGFGFVQSEIHGWNNDARTYESIPVIKPWDGYWIHTSRELDIAFRPHVQDEIVQRENRSDVWTLNMRARGISNNSAGDYITVGLSDSASVGFRYGEDEYDTPIPLGDKYIDLFFDKSEWIGGLPDINGNEISETEFIRDIRPYENLNEPKYWSISSYTYSDESVEGVAPWNDEDEVELSWNNFDAIIGLEDSIDIFLHIDNDYYNMKIEQSVIVSNITDREIVIQIGGDSPLAYDLVGLPTQFSVSAAYPNPFNPIANLDYAIPNSDNVKITIYNINGRLIETLIDEYKPAGYYAVKWNAYNISSGIYFVKVESGQNVSTQKLMLMK